MATKWKISGEYFEACNCDVVCPCVVLGDPTQGECGVLLAWHIRQGEFDGVPLGGLNIALAAHAPGNMLKAKWNVALYIDERANAAQREALGKVFGGQVGGEPAALGPLIGKVMGVKNVKIDFEANGRKRSLRIPKVAEMESEAIAGQGEKEVTISNVPLTAVPNQATVVARSKRLSFHDLGLDWEVTDKNSFYSPFSFSGP